uniref:Uncharacterized protein n=1 Tax=Rhizophora mucronata TaxID=61149 RepID=A0A2P2NVC5_RHIMU
MNVFFNQPFLQALCMTIAKRD